MKLEVISREPAGTPHPVPLLFVHGAFSSAWCWDEHFLPFFAEQGYSAHALSLRGHGSSEGAEFLHTAGLADYLEDLHTVVGRFQQPPVLIGHSMGGMLVQHYLRDHTLPAAVLMASVPPHGLFVPLLSMALRDPILLQQLFLMQAVGPSNQSQHAVRRALFSDHVPPAKLERYFSHFQNESSRISLDMMDFSALSWCDKIATPVLVMGTEQDAFVPEHMLRATARVYRAELKVFPDVAHALMLDTAWRQVAKAMAEWLSATLLPWVEAAAA